MKFIISIFIFFIKIIIIYTFNSLLKKSKYDIKYIIKGRINKNVLFSKKKLTNNFKKDFNLILNNNENNLETFEFILKRNKYQSYYTIDVLFGSKKELQELIIDTGSSLTNIPCKSTCKKCGKHIYDIFNNYESKSFKYLLINKQLSLKDKKNIEKICSSSINGKLLEKSQLNNIYCFYLLYYSEGSSYNGVISNDVIYIKNQYNYNKYLKFNNLFGCIENESKKFYNQEPNGIMGLSEIDNFYDNKTSLFSNFILNLCLSKGYLIINHTNNSNKIRIKNYNNIFTYKNPDKLHNKSNINSYKINISKITIDNFQFNLEYDINKYNSDILLFNKKSVNSLQDRKLVVYNIITNNTYALIDSGSTTSLFPNNIYSKILKAFDNACFNKNCFALKERTYKNSLCFRLLSNSNEDNLFNMLPDINFHLVNIFNKEVLINWKPKNYLIKKMYYNNKYYSLKEYDFLKLNSIDNVSISYCLGINESNSILLGQNFMVNKAIGFDVNQKHITIDYYKNKCKNITVNNNNNNSKNINIASKGFYNKSIESIVISTKNNFIFCIFVNFFYNITAISLVYILMFTILNIFK